MLPGVFRSFFCKYELARPPALVSPQPPATRCRPIPNKFWDLRVEYRIIDGRLHGIGSISRKEGGWREVGRQSVTRHKTDFVIPGPQKTLRIDSANNPVGFIKAVAVTVGQPYSKGGR